MAWCKECGKTIPVDSSRTEIKGGRTIRVTIATCEKHGKIIIEQEENGEHKKMKAESGKR